MKQSRIPFQGMKANEWVSQNPGSPRRFATRDDDHLEYILRYLETTSQDFDLCKVLFRKIPVLGMKAKVKYHTGSFNGPLFPKEGLG